MGIEVQCIEYDTIKETYALGEVRTEEVEKGLFSKRKVKEKKFDDGITTSFALTLDDLFDYIKKETCDIFKEGDSEINTKKHTHQTTGVTSYNSVIGKVSGPKVVDDCKYPYKMEMEVPGVAEVGVYVLKNHWDEFKQENNDFKNEPENLLRLFCDFETDDSEYMEEWQKIQNLFDEIPEYDFVHRGTLEDKWYLEWYRGLGYSGPDLD